jgi:hypothetical protein
MEEELDFRAKSESGPKVDPGQRGYSIGDWNLV